MHGLFYMCIKIVFSALYPAYLTFKTIKYEDKMVRIMDEYKYFVHVVQSQEYPRQVRYWTVYGVFSVAELLLDILLDPVPFYSLFKCAIVILFVCPLSPGYEVIFQCVIQPTLVKRERIIEGNVKKLIDQIRASVAQCSQATMECMRAASPVESEDGPLAMSYSDNHPVNPIGAGTDNSRRRRWSIDSGSEVASFDDVSERPYYKYNKSSLDLRYSRAEERQEVEYHQRRPSRSRHPQYEDTIHPRSSRHRATTEAGSYNWRPESKLSRDLSCWRPRDSDRGWYPRYERYRYGDRAGEHLHTSPLDHRYTSFNNMDTDITLENRAHYNQSAHSYTEDYTSNDLDTNLLLHQYSPYIHHRSLSLRRNNKSPFNYYKNTYLSNQ